MASGHEAMSVTEWDPLAAKPNADIEALAQSIIADAQKRLCGDVSFFDGANKCLQDDKQMAKLTLIDAQPKETTELI